jgi:putative heme-binding domain-containing protein
MQPPRTWRCRALAASIFAITTMTPVILDAAPQSAPDPEIERKSFKVAEGFEVNLFAANPLITKPIQMNFDSAGRLWIATSAVYPHIVPGAVADDKIIVLEDRDGDGRAEISRVFADKLLIPTGVEIGDGGAYVANSTELIHLKDTDGDGNADQTRVILSGFGTEDTHHILHTLRWGHDGQIYFNQSIYIHSHIETPHGVRRLDGGGVWQFRPKTLQLDVFIKGLVNSWGHTIDPWGQSFGTDGAGGEGINYFFPGVTFLTSPGAKRFMKGLNPGSPKHCGAEMLSGRHLPEDWRGDIITNDFRAHRVCRFKISEDGAGYASKEMPELIVSTDVAFRPVDVKIGPDGAIYIADWYNPIIQHGEVDFRDPRRDHVHGRIWRITAKDRPLVERPKLVDASIPQLLDFLKAPEKWTRLHAKRQLAERDPHAVQTELASWIAGLDPEDADEPHHRLEALWAYQTIDFPEPALLAQLLRDSDHRIRAAATRVLSQWHDRIPNAFGLLAVQIADDHPRVRLEAVRALTHFPTERSAELAMSILSRPMDRFLDFALWKTANELSPVWLPALQAGRLTFNGDASQLEFALRAVESPKVVQPLLKLVRDNKVPSNRRANVLALIAGLGNPEELSEVLDMVLNAGSADAPMLIAALAALARGTQQRQVTPAGDLSRLEKLINDKDPAIKRHAVTLAGLWQAKALRPAIIQLSNAPKTPDDLQAAAIAAIAQFAAPADVDHLTKLASQESPIQTRVRAVAGLTTIDADKAARQAIRMLAIDLPAPQAQILFDAFLRQKAGPKALAGALSSQKIPADVAKIGLRQIQQSARPEQNLTDALVRAGGLDQEMKPLTPDQLKKMVADVVKNADPARGQAIFRRQELGCLRCHAIAGAGGLVAPDLISVGASAPVDYLIESLMIPNKAVKENYHSTVVETKDGEMYAGIKIRETKSELVLRDAVDDEIVVPKNAIESLTMAGSIMPSGLVEGLTTAELRDLVGFLAALGKPGPYAVSPTPVVRTWRVLDAESIPMARVAGADFGPEINAKSLGSLLNSSAQMTWIPAYSTVAGDLPITDLPRDPTRPYAFVAFQLDVTRPGPIQLAFKNPKGLTLWLGAKSIPVKSNIHLDIDAGIHKVMLRVDRQQRTEPLNCQLVDVPGSEARAAILSGK